MFIEIGVEVMGSRNARRIKDIHGMEQIMIDLKPRRCDSFVYCNKEFDVTELVKYVSNKKQYNPNVTFFHTFVMALGKVIYNRPKLNRFVQNRHVFLHNDVVVSFVAKVTFDDKAEEIMIMVPISEHDTIDNVSQFIKDKVSGVRNGDSKKVGANSAIDVLGKFPNIIRVPLVGILKWCDDKGVLPKSLTRDNLYYSSTIVSNLGTLKSNAIHHNITNFGTCSSLATMGEIHNKEIIHDDGTREIRKVCDWGIAFDERIADGFYLIKSMDMLQYIFNHPELLEHEAFETIVYEKNSNG